MAAADRLGAETFPLIERVTANSAIYRQHDLGWQMSENLTVRSPGRRPNIA
jgi:hypothetical protein